MSYRFIDKDPVVDLVRTAIHDSGRLPQDIAADADVRRQTLRKWIYGDVRRPQNFTLFKVFRALGVRIDYVWEHNGKRLIAKPELAQTMKKPSRKRAAKAEQTSPTLN